MELAAADLRIVRYHQLGSRRYNKSEDPRFWQVLSCADRNEGREARERYAQSR